MALRALILREADLSGPHAALLETLKWGEPAYLPNKPRVGATLRLNALRAGAGHALYFPGAATRAAVFRELHGGALKIVGPRDSVWPGGRCSGSGTAALHCAGADVSPQASPGPAGFEPRLTRCGSRRPGLGLKYQKFPVPSRALLPY